MESISVIIPTLDEEQWIEKSLRSVTRQPGGTEIIVADGGSQDMTRAIARPHARVIEAPRGRAVQMNAGAEYAGGDILLFLHADTRLPEGAFSVIRDKLSSPGVEAGTFQLTFDRSSPLLQFYSVCTRIQTPVLCFGDRGLFVRRNSFNDVGRYPIMPIFEDLELSRRLYDRGGFVFADPAVTTASRRFNRNGLLYQQLKNLLLWSFYMVGGSPHRMTDYYTYPD